MALQYHTIDLLLSKLSPGLKNETKEQMKQLSPPPGRAETADWLTRGGRNACRITPGHRRGQQVVQSLRGCAMGSVLMGWRRLAWLATVPKITLLWRPAHFRSQHASAFAPVVLGAKSCQPRPLEKIDGLRTPTAPNYFFRLSIILL